MKGGKGAIPIFLDQTQDKTQFLADDMHKPTAMQGAPASKRGLLPGFLPFTLLLEAVFDAAIVCDMDGQIVYANKEAYLSQGYTREELLQIKVSDLVAPEFKEAFRRRLQEAGCGQGTSFKSVHLHKDGHRKYLEIRGQLIEVNGCKYNVLITRDIRARGAVEQRLKETKKVLNSILEHAPMPIYSAGIDGTYHLVNPAWEKLTGKQKDKVIGHCYEELFTADTARLFRHRSRQIAATKKPMFFEEIAVIKRERYYFQTAIFPIWDGQGQVAAIGGISIDITQRKQKEEALRESETTLRNLVEANPEAFFLTNGQGIVLAANRILALRLGKSLEEIIGTPISGHIPSEINQRHTAFFDQVIATGRPVHFEDINGKFHYDTYLTPISDSDGNVSKVAILSVDITARKQMEGALKQLSKELEQRVTECTAELKAVKARMEHIIDTTPAIIFTAEATPPFGVTFVSDQIRNLGYEPTEILGLNFVSLNRVHADDLGKLHWAMEALFKDHQIMVKYRIPKKDGTYVWIQNNARLIINKSGVPVGIVACWTDISRQKELEQRLEILSGPEGKISVWKKTNEVLGEIAPNLLPQSWDRLQDIFHAALQGETITGVHLQLYRKDGTFLDGLLTAGPLHNKIGDSFEAVGAIIELRHSKKTLH